MVSKAAGDGKSILGAQIHVQKNHIGRIFSDIRQKLGFGSGFKHKQPLTCKIVGDEITNVLIVINDQYN